MKAPRPRCKHDRVDWWHDQLGWKHVACVRCGKHFQCCSGEMGEAHRKLLKDMASRAKRTGGPT